MLKGQIQEVVNRDKSLTFLEYVDPLHHPLPQCREVVDSADAEFHPRELRLPLLVTDLFRLQDRRDPRQGHREGRAFDCSQGGVQLSVAAVVFVCTKPSS